MTNSRASEDHQRENVADRRAQIARWAQYVRTHDDETWSRQQNRLVDSQLQSANDLAASGDTDPARFVAARDRLRERSESTTE